MPDTHHSPPDHDPSPQDSQDTHERPRRKRRLVLTCKRCQRLKVKCDHLKPCGACVLAEREDECVYQSPPPRSGKYLNGLADPRTPPRPHKRRAVNVCARCKRLKLGCDQKHPCSTCTKAHAVEQCIFQSQTQDSYMGTPEPLSTTHTAHVTPVTLPYATDSGYTNGTPPVSNPSTISATSNTVPIAAMVAPPVELPLGMLANHAVQGHGHSHAHVVGAVKNLSPEFSDLVRAFPPVEQCKRLLSHYLNFDTMLRRVHAPSFKRRAYDVLYRLPNVDRSEAPFLSMLAAALQVGSIPAVHEVCPDLTPLMEHLQLFCKRNAMFTLDYVQSHIMAVDTQMSGPNASPAGAWMANGQAYMAAVLTRIYQDHPGETLFESELRKRMWWQIKIIHKFSCLRLRIDIPFTGPIVPRPAIISDEALESGNLADTGVDGIAEWATVDDNINFVEHVLDAQDQIMANHDLAPIEKLMQCHQLIDDYLASLPPPLHFDTAPKSPPWLFAHACLTGMSCYETAIQRVHPFINLPDIGAVAISRALEASHKLVAVAQKLHSFIMFDWIDHAGWGVWASAAKLFSAGIVLAFALLSDPNHPDAEKHNASLKVAAGILRARCTAPTVSAAIISASNTLEMLRSAIVGRTKFERRSVIDPFSGHEITMPVTTNQWPNDLGEWETLFRELFEGQPASLT